MSIKREICKIKLFDGALIVNAKIVLDFWIKKVTFRIIFLLHNKKISIDTNNRLSREIRKCNTKSHKHIEGNHDAKLVAIGSVRQ